MLVLSRNSFVCLISLLSSSVFAAGGPIRHTQGQESARGGSSHFQPYPPPTTGSQGQSSGASPFHALLAAIELSVSGQAALPFPPLVQPLVPPSLPLPAFLPPAQSSSHPIIAAASQPLPALVPAEPAVAFSADVLDFSKPDISAVEIERALQDMSAFILSQPKQKQKQKHSVTLRLCYNSTAFHNVVESIRSYPDLLVYIRHLELHNFMTNSEDNMKLLLDFLKNISLTLKKVSFINCHFTEKDMQVFKDAIKEGLLKNIVELKFTRMNIGIVTFTELLRAIVWLKKLTHLSLDVGGEKSRFFSEKTESTARISLQSLIKDENLKLKFVKVSGGLFSEKMMEALINAISDAKDCGHFNEGLEELNILKTDISQDSIIKILNELIAQEDFLPVLETLYIPNIGSTKKGDETCTLIKTLQKRRSELTILHEMNEE